MRDIFFPTLFRGKRTDNGKWIEGFYSQLPKPSLGAAKIANGDLCAEDVSDYIIVNKSKQHSNFSNAYPLEVVESEYYEIDPETLCQYTGLYDGTKWEQLSDSEQKEFLQGWNIEESRRNRKEDWQGKRLWENDIVTNKWRFIPGYSVIRYGEYKDPHMSDEYQCGNLGFYLEYLDKRYSSRYRKDIMYFAQNCIVVGNIFDTSELLKGE